MNDSMDGKDALQVSSKKKIAPQSTFPYQIRYEFTKQVCKEKKNTTQRIHKRVKGE